MLIIMVEGLLKAESGLLGILSFVGVKVEKLVQKLHTWMAFS